MAEDQQPEPGQGLSLTRGLGVASGALGLPLVAAPATVARAIGIRSTATTRTLLRAVGVQELAVAGGLLGRRRPVALQWSRVAGDIAHLGLLASALTSKRNDRGRVLGTMATVAGITVVDVVASRRLAGAATTGADGRMMEASSVITINRQPADVYRYWRAFENLPSFMFHLERVETLNADRSHWVAKGPAGTTVEWDAQIVEDRPDELIAWRSLDGATVDNAGSVRFSPAPGGRGTEVVVELRYAPPLGAVGAAVAKLFGEEPEQQLRDDLRRCKQVLETGEVVRSEASPDGARSQRQFLQRKAQPLAGGR